METDFECEPVLILAAREGHARFVDLLKGGADMNLSLVFPIYESSKEWKRWLS